MHQLINNDKIFLPIIYTFIGVFIYHLIKFILSGTLKSKHMDKRKTTIIVLIRNVVKYLIVVLVILAILEVYGVNTTSIIASLGVASVIIGLAFKDVVTDLLSGIFIIFDNQYTIGDYVEINGFKGYVISLGLRTTKIKSFTGEVKIISNSSFKEVINYNLKEATIYLKVPVAYNTKLDKLEKVLESLRPFIIDLPEVIGKYELLGLDEFGDSAMLYLIAVDVKPMMHFSAKRKILRLIKESFDKEKIEIPYNKIDVNIESR